MIDKDFIQTLNAFTATQQEAEKAGTETFICPICGGTAYWGRAEGNNHLHCGCNSCDIRIME